MSSDEQDHSGRHSLGRVGSVNFFGGGSDGAGWRVRVGVVLVCWWSSVVSTLGDARRGGRFHIPVFFLSVLVLCLVVFWHSEAMCIWWLC